LTLNEKTESARVSAARRALARRGYTLRKSRIREPHLNDLGGFQIVSTDNNLVVAGADYDLALDYVEGFVAEHCSPTN
jgi:hypothetical protein